MNTRVEISSSQILLNLLNSIVLQLKPVSKPSHPTQTLDRESIEMVSRRKSWLLASSKPSQSTQALLKTISTYSTISLQLKFTRTRPSQNFRREKWDGWVGFEKILLHWKDRKISIIFKFFGLSLWQRFFKITWKKLYHFFIT